MRVVWVLVAVLALPVGGLAAERGSGFALGAGDALGRRMYGRAVHRGAILARERGEPVGRWIRREPFDAHAWLARRKERRQDTEAR